MRFVPSLLLAAAVALAPAASAQSLKVGVFDPARILSNSKLGQKLQDELNQYRVTKEAEIKRAQEDFDKRVQQYKAGVDTMSAERREEVETDLGTRRRDLERSARDGDAELTRRRQKAVRDIEQEVAAILDDYGKRNGFTLILQRDLCAFATESIDISEELVKLLDARTSTRAAAPAPAAGGAARRP
jgi:outer membrane protein